MNEERIVQEMELRTSETGYPHATEWRGTLHHTQKLPQNESKS